MRAAGQLAWKGWPLKKIFAALDSALVLSVAERTLWAMEAYFIQTGESWFS
jgi:hypothetical protein